MTERRAPQHLEPDTRRWWREVMREFVLEPHHEKLLMLACESWDRCQEARTLIELEGLTVLDRFKQTRPHPAVAIERDSRIGFARLLRELDLDGEPQPGESRQPRLRRNT